MDESSPTLRQEVVLATAILFGLLLRTLVSLHPYSGEKTPPMFGDYEAQRHWMEIALNVKPIDWYRSTPENDLSYWGLDYPPLSGYVSWLYGKIISYIEPAAVSLLSSRGYETATSRFLMRMTVLAADVWIFFPALVLVFLVSNSKTKPASQGSSRLSKVFWYDAVMFCVTVPALILIDHGHFQYNNISLGLFLLSLLFFELDHFEFGAAFFCASLYFKQMGLYYGLAVFSYLSGMAVMWLRHEQMTKTVLRVVKVLIAIAITTVASFCPWIFHKDRMLELLRRLFPISRGLYESKVANVWCSISVLVKIQRLMPQQALFRFCAAVTAVASLPFCIPVFLRPCHQRLCLATAGCSLAAFLFSYQVHEKQILLPLLPICLLWGEYPFLTCWMSIVAAFSMFPLLHREGLATAYVATIGIHMVVVEALLRRARKTISPRKRALALCGVLLGAMLHLLLVFAKPPSFAPDIFELLNTSYACAHLCGIFLTLAMKIWTYEEATLPVTPRNKLD